MDLKNALIIISELIIIIGVMIISDKRMLRYRCTYKVDIFI